MTGARWAAGLGVVAVALGPVSCATGGPVGLRDARVRPTALGALASRVVSIGRSVEGRPIVARVLGDPQASRRVLVVGCIHGDEPAGIAVTRSLRRAQFPRGVGVWVIDTVNPDGLRHHTRQNADGVDLNRTFPVGWRPLTGIFNSGRGPLTEPESIAIHRLIVGLHPAITIWYHQHAALVDDSGGSRAIERAYADRVGLPLRPYGTVPGSITRWQDATYRRDTAFVVELPAGPLSRAAVVRHTNAVVALAAG
jgi:protein MpaA